MDDLEQSFFIKLTSLARFTNTEIPVEVFESYDKALSCYGYIKACRAVDTAMSRSNSRSPFPSIQDLISYIDPKIDPDSEAIEAANLVIQAISKFGPYRTDEFRKFVGELGWRIVERNGGVEQVCSISNEDLNNCRAQWTKLAVSQLLRYAANREGETPTLTSGNSQAGSLSFIDFLKLPEMPK